MEKSWSYRIKDKVAIAKILSPHALRGDVKVEFLTDHLEQFKKGKKFLLVNSSGTKKMELVLEKFKYFQGKPLLKFEGINDRNTAASLRGFYVLKDISEVFPAEEDNYYLFELLELEVLFEDKRVGVIKEFLFNKDGDYYFKISNDEGKENFIPFKKDFIDKIDLESKKMYLKNLEGFFEGD